MIALTSLLKTVKRILCLFAMVAVFTTPAFALDTINVVVYGDSLTSGYKLSEEASYAAQMEKKLRDMGYVNVKMTNMSRAGETSAGGLQRISSLMLADPDVVVLQLGANDLLRSVNPNVVHANLSHIISALKEKNAYVVLIGMKAPPNFGAQYRAYVDKIYSDLASKYQLAFYPFALEGIYGNPELNLADGYHPNSKGIEHMVKNTLHLVDAGVRWKYQTMLQQQQHYQQYGQ